MLPTTRAPVEQERVIEEARALLAADPRVAACWLEGSFAAGTADTWSDIDLLVATPLPTGAGSGQRDGSQLALPLDGVSAHRGQALAGTRPPGRGRR